MKKKYLALALTASMILTMAAPAAAWAEAAESTPTQEEGGDDLLGGLLGGLVGGLLGEDSKVGEILGENGELSKLLGEDGALSGLLGEDGKLAELFGEGGALSDLLGEDGKLAELFGEGGALSDLLGEDGKLAELFGEGGKLSEILGTDGELSAILGEGGALGDILEGLVSGGEDINFDDFLAGYPSWTAIEDYIKSSNEGQMDAGDEQIVIINKASDKMQDDGTVKILGYFRQDNFTAEGTELKLLGSSSFSALLTFAKDENGEWSVIDDVRGEEGSDEAEGIEKLCAEADIPTDQYYENMALEDMMVAMDYHDFMREHQEYERIEYNGEMMTEEDLDAEFDAIIEAMYPDKESDMAISGAESVLEAIEEA